MQPGVDTFRVGAALRRGLGAFVESLGPLLVIAAVPALPMALFTALVASGDLTPEAIDTWEKADQWLGTLAGALTTAAISHGILRRGPGERIHIGSSLAGALRAAWPVIAATALSALAVLIGLVFFVVPGLMIAASIYVAVPVATLERTGAMAALTRSHQLALGRRWRVIAVAAVDVTIALAGFGAVIAASEVHVTMVAEAGGDARTVYVAWMFVQVAVGIVVSALRACFAAATYHDLRADRDAASPDVVARVFA
jgi:hypothetical protein